MRLKKKLAGLLIAVLCLLPSFGQAYTIQDSLDVRGNIVGGVQGLGSNNLSLSLASGILKIQCIPASGIAADCSATNPGWITIPGSVAGGQTRTYKITSSPQFGDATAADSDFVGTGTCSWGTTAGVAWGNDMPILIGAFHNGTTLVFGLARGPVLTTGASSNIGYQDNCPSSPSQNNVIAMTSTNVTSSHANKAFYPIGAVRATKNSSDNYTFTAFDDGDGIGIFYNFGQREFDMPTGQNGATSGRYFKANGGTAPVWSTNVLKYRATLTGLIFLNMWFDGDGGTDGATAVLALLAPPYDALASSQQDRFAGAVYVKWNAGANAQVATSYFSGNNGVAIRRNNSASQVLDMNNSDFINGGRSWIGSILYSAY